MAGYLHTPDSGKPIQADNPLPTQSMDYNGSTYDIRRNNTEATILASAARTVTASSPNQTNFNARGVIISLNVTANPGGTETLSLQLRIVSAGNQNSGSIASFSTQSAVNGIYRLIVYPGASTAPDNPNTNKAYALPVPRTWFANVVPSATGSWTYQVDYQYIV